MGVAETIIEDIVKETSTNPAEIFGNMAKKEYINMHGPEHHILDGACILIAYKNAGGEIDIDSALSKMAMRGAKMPGAMCGEWGICGAISSVGAALSIIDKTTPLSTDGTWGEHMMFTAKANEELGATRGPRCCKRGAYIALKNGVEYINEHFDVKLDWEQGACHYSSVNKQCSTDQCPYYAKEA